MAAGARLRTVARFEVGYGCWRIDVQVLPSAREMHALWLRRGGQSLRRGEYLHGLFFERPRAPLGTMALSAADLSAENVVHESVHAAMHALRLTSGATQVAAVLEHEEYVARTAGVIAHRVMRGLVLRGIRCV